VTATAAPAFAPPSRFSHARSDYYREEFLRHQWCLEQQREYYSERAILDAEWALARVIDRLDELCGRDGADELIGLLLKKFDLVTGLSAWESPQAKH
jgi:hypothetical protein